MRHIAVVVVIFCSVFAMAEKPSVFLSDDGFFRSTEGMSEAEKNVVLENCIAELNAKLTKLMHEPGLYVTRVQDCRRIDVQHPINGWNSGDWVAGGIDYIYEAATAAPDTATSN